MNTISLESPTYPEIPEEDRHNPAEDPDIPEADQESPAADLDSPGHSRVRTRQQALVLLVVFLLELLTALPSATLAVLYLDYVEHFNVSLTAVSFLPSVYDIGGIISG